MTESDKLDNGRRLSAILHGAFSGPPTPFNNIPKKNGESRAGQPKKAQRRKRQRKNRAA